MRILACADIHGNQQVYRWLAAAGAKHSVDQVVLAGDLFGFPEEFPTVEAAQEAEGRQAAGIFIEAGTSVLYIMGNDDWIEWNPNHPSIQSLHGRRLEFKGLNFVGYQFTPPFVGSMHEKPESEIRSDLDGLAPLVDENTVLVTHGPARLLLPPGADESARIGSSALSDFLDRHPVRAHIHGHVHHEFGREANRFNVAAAAQCRAMVIDLDTLRHEVLTA